MIVCAPNHYDRLAADENYRQAFDGINGVISPTMVGAAEQAALAMLEPPRI